MRGKLGRPMPVLTGVAAVGAFVLSPGIAGADHADDHGRFVRYTDQVPAGATGTVSAVYDSTGDTTVKLTVRGLAPRTRYAAHAHEQPCGPTGADAGAHYQDAYAPQSHPAYAERNEIRLSFRTDRHGDAVGSTTVAWQFPPGRRARSLVLHTQRIVQLPYQAPFRVTTVARLACLDVDLQGSDRVRSILP